MMKAKAQFQTRLDSPLGTLLISSTDETITAIDFDADDRTPNTDKDHPLLSEASQQLRQYFTGDLSKFDLPFVATGTDFEQTVWQKLMDIPYGQTLSYGQLAQKLGDPNKVRAVGRANGQNPISIIIPCHRVIGANGHLTGYGGGIERKKWLLQHEGALLL